MPNSMYLLLLCQIRDNNSIRKGNALAPNRRNSVPWTLGQLGLSDKGLKLRMSYKAKRNPIDESIGN